MSGARGVGSSKKSMHKAVLLSLLQLFVIEGFVPQRLVPLLRRGATAETAESDEWMSEYLVRVQEARLGRFVCVRTMR